MNLDTDENPVRAVLDTNILISAILFGGKPDQVLSLVIEEKLIGVISPVLISELKEVFSKKFPLKEADFKLTFKNIEEIFITVQPEKTIDIVKDEDDNRVLEAALEGKCNYIITGDKDLLDLKTFKNIKIMTPDAFLSNIIID
jgi:hypothetical protein